MHYAGGCFVLCQRQHDLGDVILRIGDGGGIDDITLNGVAFEGKFFFFGVFQHGFVGGEDRIGTAFVDPRKNDIAAEFAVADAAETERMDLHVVKTKLRFLGEEFVDRL